MTRLILAGSLLLAAGCPGPAPSAPPEPVPPAPDPPREVTLIPVEAVVQYEQLWPPAGFDPSGRVAVGRRCGAWRDDVYVGRISEERCAAWTRPEADEPSDGRRQPIVLEPETSTNEFLSWIEAPRSQFIAIMHEAGDEGSMGTVEFEVSEIGEVDRRWSRRYSAEPGKGGRRPKGGTMEEDTLERQPAEMITLGMRDDVLEVEWRQCFHGAMQLARPGENGERWVERGWCEPHGRSMKGCELLDLAPSRGYALSMCGKGALTLVGPGGERVDLGTVVSRADEDSLEWSWGRDWLVTIDRSNGVVWRSLEQPASGRTLGPSEAWVPTILGPDLDRIVLRDGEGLQVFDAISGQSRARVATTLGPAIGAALSPSGERLAVTDGVMVEARSLSDDTPLATWDAAGSPYLAWRQDERVVFSGPDILGPTLAWDLERGAVPDALPERGAAFPLDPSWRWRLLDRHRVRRVIDGLALSFDASGVLLDDGRFEGSPEGLGDLMYRVGEDRAYSPMLAPEAMRPVMEVEGLRATFFAGRPIATDPITVTESQRDALLGR